MVDPRRKIKKAGMAAAKKWIEAAAPQEQIDVAGSCFEYGETLDGLIAEGYEVPSSPDVNFSWGFFKQVKGRVNHKLWSSDRARK